MLFITHGALEKLKKQGVPSEGKRCSQFKLRTVCMVCPVLVITTVDPRLRSGCKSKGLTADRRSVKPAPIEISLCLLACWLAGLLACWLADGYLACKLAHNKNVKAWKNN